METQQAKSATQEFDPMQVVITYNLNIRHVNLILEALSELPRKMTGDFFDQFRDHASKTMKEAEANHGQHDV